MSAGIAGRQRGPSDSSANHLGQLVNPVDLGHDHNSPGRSDRPRGTSDPSPRHPGELVDPMGHGPGPESPGTLVDTACPRTRAQVTRDSWSSPQDFTHGAKLPGTSGQNHMPLDPGSCHPGQLVDTSGLRTHALVARESCLTPRSLGRHCELPGRAGRPRGPRTRARVAQESWTTAWAFGHVRVSSGRAV